MRLAPALLRLAIAAAAWLGLVGCAAIDRALLFHPTHHAQNRGLTAWIKDGAVIGYARPVSVPRNVWLFIHGNAGQAADRVYALPRFADDDAVFILEYPGYGQRPGRPSRDSFNRAAQEAYAWLRTTYPALPVCVAAESIGSGPAATLATLPRAPDKFVFIVPYARLSHVAQDHAPAFLVSLLLNTDWDNAEALASYRGPVDIFGAEADTVIPVKHARALAAALPQAQLHLVPGGHNDWSDHTLLRIRNP